MTTPMKVAICVPAGDSVGTEFASDLTGLVAYQATRQPAGSSLQVFFSKGGQPAVQRCDLVRLALGAGADWLLWLSPDMRFPRGALERLLSLETAVVGANYLAPVSPFLPVAAKSLDPETRIRTEKSSSGLEFVQATGMGLLLTSAEVFRKLPEPWFMVGFNADSKSYFGEELYFCRRVTEAGYRIVIDHDLSKLVGRSGTYEYREDTITRPKAPAKARAAAPAEAAPAQKKSTKANKSTT
ncbi:MAG: hypothetical protein IT483_12520 [Gammaproteobacteria bacterium]|nr:hypothetical protein [Gammaproteobacteria bacterium]